MLIRPLYHTRFWQWCVEVHMIVVWAIYTLFKLYKQEISGTESKQSSVKTGNDTLLFSLAPVVKRHIPNRSFISSSSSIFLHGCSRLQTNISTEFGAHTYASKRVLQHSIYTVYRGWKLLNALTSFVTTRALNIIFLATVSCNICRKLKFYGDFKQSTVRYFTLSAYEAQTTDINLNNISVLPFSLNLKFQKLYLHPSSAQQLNVIRYTRGTSDQQSQR